MTYVLEIILFVLVFLIGQWNKQDHRKSLVYVGFVISFGVFVFLQHCNSLGDTKKDQTIRGLNRNIEVLHKEIGRLSSTVNKQSVMIEQLKNLLLAALPDDVLKKAENLYQKAIIDMEMGNELESAKAFKELSGLALEVNSYNTAAIAALISASRYEEANAPLEAAKLKSEAGDIYLQFNQVDEAKLWKREALKIYSNHDESGQVQMLRQEIQSLDLEYPKTR